MIKVITGDMGQVRGNYYDSPIYGLLPKNPRKLKFKRRNPLEWLASLIMQSHVCQICKRKEIWSVESWLQVDCPFWVDKYGCSSICSICVNLNKEIFKDETDDYY